MDCYGFQQKLLHIYYSSFYSKGTLRKEKFTCSSSSFGNGCNGDSAFALLAAFSTRDIICSIDLPSFEAIGLHFSSPNSTSD